MRIYHFVPILASILIGIYFYTSKTPPNDKTGAPSAQNVYEQLTGDDIEEYEERWDRYYNTDRYVYGIAPAAFLKNHVRLLPKGRVLDIAMGEGRNAVFLAAHGFTVEGVDISQVALAKANRLAKKRKVKIKTIHAGLANYKIAPNTYDVILNIDFLMMNLIPKIKAGLKPGGVLVFETHTTDPLQPNEKNAVRAEWTLNKGELKQIFSDFEILAFEEIKNDNSTSEAIVARKKLK